MFVRICCRGSWARVLRGVFLLTFVEISVLDFTNFGTNVRFWTFGIPRTSARLAPTRFS